MILRHCGGRIHRLHRCHNHARQAGHAPNPLSLKTRGGGGGAWGVLHTRTGPGRPPRGITIAPKGVPFFSDMHNNTPKCTRNEG